MSGLLRRIRGGRAADPEPLPDATDDGTADAIPRDDADPTHAAGGDASATAEPAAHPDLPAGTDLDLLVGERPTTRRRGRLRRRLRHLRRVREVLLRDLGGVVFEIHRSAAHGADAVVAGKLERLSGVDAEIRELESILDDRRPMVLREPGIGGSCPTCGELFGSDARFCWACGMPLVPGAARPIVSTGPGLPAAPAHADAPVPAPVTGAAETTPAPAGDPAEAPTTELAASRPAEERQAEAAPEAQTEAAAGDAPGEEPAIEGHGEEIRAESAESWVLPADHPAEEPPAVEPGDPLSAPTERPT